jgi:hypothetical protein
MWIKFSIDYISGMVSGAGLLLLLLAIAVDAGTLNAEGLKGAGPKFAALALILAGGGMKWRSQLTSKVA